MSHTPVILFAGGGSGGHIFPNLAVLERLEEAGAALQAHFVVSNRAVDAEILRPQELPFTALPVRPWSSRPWHWLSFAAAWSQSTAIVRDLLFSRPVAAVVSTGGFVSGPVIKAAAAANVPVLMMNLDAVPGRANKLLATQATYLFSAYNTPVLPDAEPIGVPLRRCAIGPEDRRAARQQLGLDPMRSTLLITGASQGATTINRAMMQMTRLAVPSAALASWQLLHLAGAEADVEELRRSYAAAEIPARVEPFLSEMGLAWRAADIAISRAGAGSVAEVWANATPTIFLPYPWHKDQHQRLNAEPLMRGGGASILTDRIDPMANARQLAGPLIMLMNNPRKRDNMRKWLTDHCPTDGAALVAERLLPLLAAAQARANGVLPDDEEDPAHVSPN